jgi:hypothetical protein
MKKRTWIALLFAASGLASPVVAQTEEAVRPIRGWAGGGLIVAAPVGEFDSYVGTGWGLGGHFGIKLDEYGILSLRADAGFVNYGNEKKRVCLSPTVGCRIEVDLTTSNNIFVFNLGPQLAVPGGPLQPYINASIGGSYFATVSSLSGSSTDEDFASTTNFDDFTLSWHLGSGLRIPIHVGQSPFYIDFGARYNINGEVEYLTEGGIIDEPDGSITLNPIRSDANLITFVIGASFGLRW